MTGGLLLFVPLPSFLPAMPSLFVRPRARIFHGHDWVYGAEVLRASGDPQPGEVVLLKDQRDRMLGSAIYNPASQIVARRISRRKQDLDADFFVRRLQRALAWRRQEGIDPALARLVWSEADGLPGVVVDAYGPHVVFQTNTLAMDLRRDLLVGAIREVLAPHSVIERNDSNARKAEGMEMRCGVAAGDDPGPVEIAVNGLRFTLDLLHGQKTGFYLDQIANYAAVARRAGGRRVLDAFCNQGGFALHCAAAGAARVLALDIAEDAVARTRENARLNGFDQVEARTVNVFDALREFESAGEPPFDLVVLDPPSFTRNRRAVGDAMRGYKEIHLRALKLLAPDGLLATYTCSHHISREEYLAMVVEAAVDAKRSLRLVESHTQRADHPVLPAIPETEYLKGFVFQSVAAW